MSLRPVFCKEIGSLGPRDPWLQLLFKLSLKSLTPLLSLPFPLPNSLLRNLRAVRRSDLTQQENKNKTKNTKPKQNNPGH